MAVLPTDSPMDIKLIIILIYSVGEVSTIHIFRGPLVIPSAK
jgi:hypothetical protein